MTRKILIGVLSKREFHNSVVYDSTLNFSTKYTTTVCARKINPDEIFAIVTEPKEGDTDENRYLFEYFKKDLERDEIQYKNGVNKISISNDVDNDDYLKLLYRELYDKIKDGDEIFLDITGGFRPIPLVLVEVIHYVKQIKKNVAIKNVFYGEYNPKNKEGNFYSVGYFLDLSEWAIGVQNYVNYADASYLKKLVRNEKKYEGSIAIRLVDSLDLFSNYLKVCQWKDAKGLFDSTISKDIDIFFGHFFPKNILELNILKDLESLLRSKFEQYKNNCYVGSVLWCQEHGNYQQALTLLNEFFKNHLIENGYVKKNESFEIFKKMNDDWNIDCWQIEEPDILCSCLDSDYMFYLKIKNKLKSVCNFSDPNYDELSELVKIKIDSNHKIHKELDDMYRNSVIRDDFKTLDWYLAFLIQPYLSNYMVKLRKELALELGCKTEKVKQICYRVDIRKSGWSKRLSEQTGYSISKEIENQIKQYKNCDYTLKMIKKELEDASHLYTIVRKCDKRDNLISSNNRKKIPFQEMISTRVTEKFIKNKGELFQLFLDWNKVREYRNCIDHAQMLNKYNDFNYILEKEKPEFQERIQRLLNFIEKEEKTETM